MLLFPRPLSSDRRANRVLEERWFCSCLAVGRRDGREAEWRNYRPFIHGPSALLAVIHHVSNMAPLSSLSHLTSHSLTHISQLLCSFGLSCPCIILTHISQLPVFMFVFLSSFYTISSPSIDSPLQISFTYVCYKNVSRYDIGSSSEVPPVTIIIIIMWHFCSCILLKRLMFLKVKKQFRIMCICNSSNVTNVTNMDNKTTYHPLTHTTQNGQICGN